MARAAFGLLLLAACGADEPRLEDHAQSGTRLHLQLWDAASVRSVASDLVYDAQLDVLCRPLTWSDGVSYCAPTDEQGNADLMYADAGCTQPLAAVPKTACTPPAFAVDFDEVGISRLVEVGAASTATQYYDLTNGTCIGPLEVAGNRNHVFHATGRAIDPAMLATIAPGPVRGSGRVRRIYLESPDGLRLPFAYHDTKLGADCRMRTGGGTSSCVPDAVVVGISTYRDAACTDPLVESTLVGGATYVSYLGDVYRPGAPISVPPLYASFSDGCRAVDPLPGVTYRPLGPEVVLDELARVPESSARISPLLLKSDESVLREPGFFDRDHDAECRPGTFADGIMRCVPRAGGLRTYYTEPTCTTTVELHEHILRPDASPPPYLVEGEVRDCAGVITALSTLGDVRGGAVFDKTSTGLCVAHQAPGGEIVPAAYYLAGAPVDPSRLVEVTLVR